MQKKEQDLLYAEILMHGVSLLYCNVPNQEHHEEHREMYVWYLQKQQSQEHSSELWWPCRQQSNTVEVNKDVCRRLELEDVAQVA